MAGTSPKEGAPSTYLVGAILMLFCCNPLFGVISIILSIMTYGAKNAQKMEEAKSYSRANFWVLISGLALGILGGLAYFAMEIMTRAQA